MLSTTPQYGHFELERRLASGGMGELYLAHDSTSRLYRPVALKRLFPHLAEHSETMALFWHEAEVLAALYHPNVPQFFALGQVLDTWFLAMEYVPGETLRSVFDTVASHGRVVPMQAALAIGIQLCETLQHVHQRLDLSGSPLSIVHRDVTPDNIILTTEGHVKLVDFGVSQSSMSRTCVDQPLRGTLSYMAPELVRGGHATAASDLFSLGVILYELTTGLRLFQGPEVQVLTAVVDREPVAPSTYDPDYPPELEALILESLSQDPLKRPSSAGRMGRMLERIAITRRLSVRPEIVSRLLNGLWPLGFNHHPEPMSEASLHRVPAGQTPSEEGTLLTFGETWSSDQTTPDDITRPGAEPHVWDSEGSSRRK